MPTKPATILSLIGRSVQQEQQEQQEEQQEQQQEEQSLAMVWAYVATKKDKDGTEVTEKRELAPCSENLRAFIEEYADIPIEGENIVRPGNPEACIQICQEQGITDLFDLKALAKRVWLGEYFPAKVAIRFENALESPEMVIEFKELEKAAVAAEAEKKTGKESHTRKPWIGTFYFSNTIESMESACATYGILSALMLTMNVACFGSMEVDEWEAFKDGIGKQRCQEGAILGWRKANQSEVECIDDLVDISEFLFVTSNYGACLLLLTTLLLSSWLYIAFSMPGADTSRPDEVQAVVARFSGEFLSLNIIFVLSVIFSVLALNQFVQLKLRTWTLVPITTTIGGIVVFFIIVMAIWILIEINIAKYHVEGLRGQLGGITDEYELFTSQKSKEFKKNGASTGRSLRRSRISARAGLRRRTSRRRARSAGCCGADDGG